MEYINILIYFGILILALVLVVFYYYNKFVQGRNEVENSFAQIDVQLKRRYELIPNLIEVAKKYMSHEHQALKDVIQARGAAVNSSGQFARDKTNLNAEVSMMNAEAMLGGAMGRLMATFEAYPDLKADGQMTQLNEELISTDNRIAFARQAYNDVVMKYNNSIQLMPAAIFAGLFSFKKMQMLEVIKEEKEREAVKVSF